MDQAIDGAPDAQWIPSMTKDQCGWSVDIGENRGDNFGVFGQPMVMQGKNRRSVGAATDVDARQLIFDLLPKDLGVRARVNPAPGREDPSSPRKTLLLEPCIDSW